MTVVEQTDGACFSAMIFLNKVYMTDRSPGLLIAAAGSSRGPGMVFLVRRPDSLARSINGSFVGVRMALQLILAKA